MKATKSVKSKRKYSRRKYSTRYPDGFLDKEYKPRLRDLCSKDEIVESSMNHDAVLPSFSQIHTSNNSPYLDISSPILDALYDVLIEEHAT